MKVNDDDPRQAAAEMFDRPRMSRTRRSRAAHRADENDKYDTGTPDPRRLADAIDAKSPFRSSGMSVERDGTVSFDDDENV